jgi:hypothetical protein
MLHSEQNIDDLEQSLLIYHDYNSESEISSEPIIIIPKQYNWNCFYIYVLVWITIIMILIFVGIYFNL